MANDYNLRSTNKQFSRRELPSEERVLHDNGFVQDIINTRPLGNTEGLDHLQNNIEQNQIDQSPDGNNRNISTCNDADNMNEIDMNHDQASEVLEKQNHNTTSYANNHDSELLKQISILISNQKDDIIQNITITTQKLEEKIENVRRELKEDIERQQINFEERLKIKFDTFTKEVDGRIIEHANHCDIKIQSTIEQQKEENKLLLQKQETNLKELIMPKVNTNLEKIKVQEGTVNQMKQTLELHETQINALETKVNSTPIYPQQIHLTCPNGGSNTELTPPKFYGREHNPMELLSKIKRYFEKFTAKSIDKNNTEILHDTIENCLEQHAARWWSLIKLDVKSWEDFKLAFENKYWSHEVQRGIRQRLEFEKYRPNGRLTRAEYFTERVITLRSMTPTPSDEEIICCLSEHFDEIIKNSLRVQHIKSIQEFELLLQREDLQDLHQRSKRQIVKENQFSNSHYISTHNNPSQKPENKGLKDHINFKAYQPKFHNSPHKYQTHKNYPPHNQRFQTQHQPQNFYRSNQNSYPPEGYYKQKDDILPRSNRYPTDEQRNVCHIIADENNSRSKSPTPLTEQYNSLNS